MKCRYCRQEIVTREIPDRDKSFIPEQWVEFIHADGNLFCDDTHTHAARRDDELSVLDVQNRHPGAEIMTYTLGHGPDAADPRPFILFAHEHIHLRDELTLATHVYLGWEKDKLSLERTDYAN